MIDTARQIDAVTRTFRVEERDGARYNVQSLTQTYPATLEDAWDAVTTAERIAGWFLPISGELRLGGRYQLQGNAGGEILECAPPSDGRASYFITWEFGGGVSWVRILLDAVEDGTRVTLEHSASASDLPSEFWDTYGPGATGVGWDGGLLGLALHLGAGEGSLKPAEAAAWAVSDEGKHFYRLSADSWAAAHIASGASEEAAKAAADNTYRFFTGDEQ